MTNSNIMTSSHILFAGVSLFLCLFLEGLPQIAHGSSVLTGYTAYLPLCFCGLHDFSVYVSRIDCFVNGM